MAPLTRSKLGSRRDPLVSLPELPAGDQMAPVLDDPQVPGHKQFCPNSGCRQPVGRACDDRRGEAEGYCQRCRTWFSFRPLLQPGALVGDGQFKVEGAIAHGGLGWFYRAWDCWVPRWVVLKGLIDPDDPDSRQAAVAELAALADPSHPNIVTVLTVVRHPHPLTARDVDYIVMECLSGRSLKQLLHGRPDEDPHLRVDHMCGYALDVLAALDHQHVKRGLLSCDLSATDLYSLARMMAVLSFPFPGFSAGEPIPGPDEVELPATHPSFAALLRRASDPDPHRRFACAAFPAVSTRFGPELRVVGADPQVCPTVRPDSGATALALPDPQVDPADPHAGLLAAINDESPDEIERVLVALPDPPLETRLRVVRAQIEPGEAAPTLALALCAAHEGAAELAAHRYATVWRTDRSYVSVAFGLTQVRFAVGDDAGAAAALEAVPESSRYAVIARLCAILARARGCVAGRPPVADFFTTAEQLITLDLDDHRRELGIIEVLETALNWHHAGRARLHGGTGARGHGGTGARGHGGTTSIPATLLGHQLTERGLRDGLECTYRKLARRAAATAERVAYVEHANYRWNRSWT